MISNYNLCIAGLASSASGLACLAYTLAHAYELLENNASEASSLEILTDLSKVARVGSGSACRSLFGGYVKWEMGMHADGEDSAAVQVAPRSHWPEMRALILVVNDATKDVSSTAGSHNATYVIELQNLTVSYSK